MYHLFYQLQMLSYTSLNFTQIVKKNELFTKFWTICKQESEFRSVVCKEVFYLSRKVFTKKNSKKEFQIHKIPPTADTWNTVPKQKSENAPDQPNQRLQKWLQQHTPLSSPPFACYLLQLDIDRPSFTKYPPRQLKKWKRFSLSVIYFVLSKHTLNENYGIRTYCDFYDILITVNFPY